MTGTRLNYGIPDIMLSRVEGGSVNPSYFAGHPLVVVFCPTDQTGETGELRQYAKYACDLVSYDAWLITIHRNGEVPKRESGCLTASAVDPNDLAWTAFLDIADPAQPLKRVEGAAFLFGRGGSLQRIWPGSGHAAEVIDELAQRMSELNASESQVPIER